MNPEENPIQPSGLYRKLTLTFALITLVASLISAVFILTYERAAHRTLKRELTRSLAGTLSMSISRVFFTGRYRTALFLQDLAERDPRIKNIYIYDASGKIIVSSESYQTANTVNPKALEAIELLAVNDNYYEESGEQSGEEYVWIGFNSGYLNEQMQFLRIGLDIQSHHRSGFIVLILTISILALLTAATLFFTNRLSLRLAGPVHELAMRFANVLRYTPANVVLYDVRGNILVGSVSFFEFVRKSGFQLKNNNYLEWTKNFPNVYEHQKKNIEHILRTGNYIIGEVPVRLPDHTVYIYSSQFPVNIEAQSRPVFGEIFIDVTTQKELEMKLEELSRKQEEIIFERTQSLRKKEKENLRQERILLHQSRIAALGEMMGAIAHQWRQPLTTLSLTFMNLEDELSESEGPGEEIIEMLHKGNTIIQYLSTTIDDFRNFFTASREKANFDINQAIQDALRIVEAQLKNSRIELSLSQKTSAIVFGHEKEFQQAIINIILNARDAILAQKKDLGKISISEHIEGNFVHIRIEDNGTGIPESIIEKIFDPYFTTKTQQQGTGIGLYMSKMIIEKNMEGILSASNNDVGASILIQLPLSTTQAD